MTPLLDGLDLRQVAGGSTLAVRVTPRSGKDQLEGVRDGALRVRLRAAPVEGAANAALVRLIARTLGMPPSAVSVAAGASSRSKRVTVMGLAVDVARERLAAALGEGRGCRYSA